MAFLAFGLFTFNGCGKGHSHEHEHGQNVENGENPGDSDASKSKYMCPMECEGSNLEEAGQCPVCGMDLVLRSDWEKELAKERGEEEESHEGHDH